MKKILAFIVKLFYCIIKRLFHYKSFLFVKVERQIKINRKTSFALIFRQFTASIQKLFLSNFLSYPFYYIVKR